MARIDQTMAHSMRFSRDITQDAVNVKNSFTSWDSCMNAAYCKWPVIALMIVGGLIILSIVSCIIRCACCAKSCCCSCFSCFKCCGNCCGCCDPPGGSQKKHVDAPYFPPHNGYQPPQPMIAGGVGYSEPPKFATFETGPTGMAISPAPKLVNDDALPPMPSWEAAAKKHIPTEDENNAVEMGTLDPKTGQRIPLMSGADGVSRTASPGPGYATSPSPHNAFVGQALGIPRQMTPVGGQGNVNRGDPYAQQNYGHPGQANYNDGSFNPNGPVSPMSATGQTYQPRDPYNQNGTYQSDAYQNSGYQNSSNNVSGTQFMAAPYPAAQPQQPYATPGQQYPRAQPQRQLSNDPNYPLIGGGQPQQQQRSYPPTPQDSYAVPAGGPRRPSPPQEYGNNPRQGSPPHEMYSSPPRRQNTGGSAYGQPPPFNRNDSYGQSIAPSYATRDPAPRGGYPHGGQGAVEMPGHGIREQDRWGPV